MVVEDWPVEGSQPLAWPTWHRDFEDHFHSGIFYPPTSFYGGKILQWSGMWGWSWIIDTMTRWWFQIFFNFHLYLGKDVPIWRAYFSDGLVQPPTRLGERMFREISKGVFFLFEIPSAPSALDLAGAQPGEIKEPRVDCGTTLCCQETQRGVAWHGGMACGRLGGGRG